MFKNKSVSNYIFCQNDTILKTERILRLLKNTRKHLSSFLFKANISKNVFRRKTVPYKICNKMFYVVQISGVYSLLKRLEILQFFCIALQSSAPNLLKTQDFMQEYSRTMFLLCYAVQK